MARCVDVYGQFQPGLTARVSVEDRGFLFADGVYEVFALFNGQPFDLAPHLRRLDRSLGALGIDRPMSEGALKARLAEVVRRNRVREGTLYLQITRGVAPRDHAFPAAARPSVVAWAKRFDFTQRLAQARTGVTVVSTPDLRWGRPDIKSVALLPNVLAKQQAREAGAFEAWLVRADGVVSEGSSTNAWIVDAGGTIVTHPEGREILSGVMRGTLLRLARAHQMRVEERPFTLAEARSAREAFTTSTTAPCIPVVSIDGAPVGDGRPGPVTGQLVALLWEEIARQTGYLPG